MSLTGDIQILNGWANECRIILWSLEDDLDWRTISQYQAAQHDGIGYIALANRAVINDLIEAMQYFVYGHMSSFSYTKWQTVHTGLYNWEHEMSLAKWLGYYIWAPDDVRAGHRMLLDAYHSSMYDKPFDAEYHALWVQRFSTWTY